MNRPSFSAALDARTESAVTRVALALTVSSTASGAAILVWSAGERGLGTPPTGTPDGVLALAGFAMGFCALFASFAALYSVLSRQPRPPLEPF